MSCGVGRRCGSDQALLWLWCRPTAVGLIGPLAWELPHAANAALKGKKKKKKNLTTVAWVQQRCRFDPWPVVQWVKGSSFVTTVNAAINLKKKKKKQEKNIKYRLFIFLSFHALHVSLAFIFSSFLFFLFLFWPPLGTLSSPARDQIQATVAVNATAVARPDPLTHCARLRIKPASWHYRDAADSVVPLAFL